jgi:hypothetical protein
MKTYDIGSIYIIDTKGTHTVYKVSDIKNGWVFYDQLLSIPTSSGSFAIGSFFCDNSKPYDFDIKLSDFINYAESVINVIRNKRIFPQDTMFSLSSIYVNYKMHVSYEKAGKKYIKL